MNWNSGYTSRYFGMIVDPISWADTEQFTIAGGSIKRASTGLRESVSLDGVDIDLNSEKWVRIYLDARQGRQSTVIPLFTGIATSPDYTYDGLLKTTPIECYSVLKASNDVYLERGWYAPSGGDGAGLAKTLLERSTPAPVVVDGGESRRLSSHIIAENNETCLTMADKILAAINWRIRIQGDGTIRICPQATAPSAFYDSIENDAIEPQLTLKKDWYVCPNVFRATSGNSYAIAKDESIDSPLSIKNRGREVWAEETDLNVTESLISYAKRRLKQLQSYAFQIKYTRRYNPNVLVTDFVNLNYPAQGLYGNYKVTGQSITLGYACSTSEDVEMTI